MDNNKTRQKAYEEYKIAEKYFNNKCCTSPSYDMAIISYNKSYNYYKYLKDTVMVLDISEKIIICNQKISNYIGVAIQYENIINYLIINKSINYNEIIKYYEYGYNTYLFINEINKSIQILLQCLKYLEKIKYEEINKYNEIIDKIIITQNRYTEDEKLYKIDILKSLFPFIVKYCDKIKNIEYMKNMIKIFRELKQQHNIYVIMLSTIVYLISEYDFENTKTILCEFYKEDDFILSEECHIARKLYFLLCCNENLIDNEEFNELIKNKLFNKIIREIYIKLKNCDIDKINEMNFMKISIL
jgi:hypothetical protein